MNQKKQNKIDQLKKKLLGLEMALKLLEDDIDTVNINLAYLEKIQEDLIYNINLHKSGKVITEISGYRKSVDELKIVQLEITKFKNNQHLIKNKMQQKLTAYDYYFEKYIQEVENEKRQSKILLFKKKENKG